MFTPSNEASHLKAEFNQGYIWLICTVAALGGLLFGWDWVVIGGAKPFFERYFNIHQDALLSGWTNSCALVGCLAGALFSGFLSDRFGRKPLLLLSAILFAVTSIGNGLAHDLFLFIFWRILGGTAIGIASSLSPMYISEVAPPAQRGRLVSINQLTIVIGVLTAQLLNWWLVRDLPPKADDAYIISSWFGQQGWRWMFALTAAPSLLFFVGMLLVPESPRWLITRGRETQARETLRRIGGETYADHVVAEARNAMERVVEKSMNWRALLDRRLRRVIVLGVMLAVFQQWCGINVIFNYAEEIFRAAGYDISTVLQNIVWTGSVNFLFTLVAIGLVDRAGRRMLLLSGAFGLAIIYIALGGCYYFHITGLPVLLLVLAAIGCYAMSLAPVTWVVISEIFPTRVRGVAMSIAVASLWIACFLLTITFPILNKLLGAAGTFWIYSGICVIGGVYLLRTLPETKGESLEALERRLESVTPAP